jgi:hypothetical protein
MFCTSDAETNREKYKMQFLYSNVALKWFFSMNTLTLSIFVPVQSQDLNFQRHMLSVLWLLMFNE